MGSGVLFGIAFTAVAVSATRLVAPSLRPGVLALLLSAAAAVYVGAVLASEAGSATVETAAFVLFGAAALVGWERPGVLAAGWLGHAGWDLIHLLGGLAGGPPSWYQVGCLVADPLLAAYILFWLAGVGGRTRRAPSPATQARPGV